MRALLAAVLLLSGVSLAYDSKCYRDGGVSCAEGPDAARNRWIGPSDEHRELLQLAGAFSGIPATLFRDFTLPTFVGPELVTIEGVPTPTLQPAPLVSATALAPRTWSVAEFAQLPDHSYSLADWALGNETCPLDDFLRAPLAATTCHQFAGHMGMLNSNHFMPQAEEFYRYYHRLALDRAAECQRLRQGVPTASRARFDDFFTACTQQALVVEAVGQHFLQDAWSSGHMWERWGSTDPRAFPDEQTGVMIALTTGLIHGVRGVFQSGLQSTQDDLGLGGLALIDFDDAMCAPHDQVRYVGGGSTQPTPVAGDLYSLEVLTNSGFSVQRAQFLSCSVSGLREVYAATGQSPGPSTGTGLFSIDPLAESCFSQRVTNSALRKGAGLDFTTAVGVRVFVPLDPTLAGGLLAVGSEVVGKGIGADFAEGDTLDRAGRYRHSLIRIASQLEFHAKADPDGTGLASGLLHPLMDVDVNSKYAFRNPRAPYIDPPLPWTPASGDRVQSWRAALAQVFHRAHALDWCPVFAPGGAQDLQALRASVTVATMGTPAREAACGVCVEFAARHVRQGADAATYDRGTEPLCGFFDSAAAPVQFVYQDQDPVEPRAAASTWCGCDPLVVSPPAVTLAANETFQFAALLDGAPLTNAVWTATGGSIAADGTFTAGTTLGTFVVRASKPGDATVFAQAKVTIAPTLQLAVTFPPNVVENMPTPLEAVVTLLDPGTGVSTPAAGVTVAVIATDASAAPATGSTDLQGRFRSDITPRAGAGGLSLNITATALNGARATSRATAAVGSVCATATPRVLTSSLFITSQAEALANVDVGQADSLIINGTGAAFEVDLPCLAQVSGVTVNGSAVTSIRLSGLRTVAIGSVNVRSTTALTSLKLPSLTTVGEVIQIGAFFTGPLQVFGNTSLTQLVLGPARTGNRVSGSSRLELFANPLLTDLSGIHSSLRANTGYGFGLGALANGFTEAEGVALANRIQVSGTVCSADGVNAPRCYSGPPYAP